MVVADAEIMSLEDFALNEVYRSVRMKRLSTIHSMPVLQIFSRDEQERSSTL